MTEYQVNNVMVPLFLLETVATGCLAVIFYYLKYLDNFKDRRYPLPCADIQWIAYPYYPETANLPLSLTDPGLYTVCFFIPTIIIVFLEIIHWFFYQGEKKTIIAACLNWTFHFFTRRIIRIIGTFLFGYFMSMVITFTFKYMFAIPRPHFLAACQLNSTAIGAECEGNIYLDRLPASATFLPSKNICLASSHTVSEALRSFPSEHAALPAYSAVFLAAYLHRMTAFRRLVTVRPLLIVLCLIGGATPGIGSLNAFQVRWVDLLVGYLLGAGLALYLTQVTLYQFAELKPHRRMLETVANLPSPQSQTALSFGTQEDATALFHSPALDRDGAPSIPRANPSSPAVRVNEVANRSGFVEPPGSYTNRGFLGPRVLPRKAY